MIIYTVILGGIIAVVSTIIGKSIMAMMILSATFIVALGTIVFSDVDVAAAIAGIFSIVNVMLNVYLTDRLNRVKKVAERVEDKVTDE